MQNIFGIIPSSKNIDLHINFGKTEVVDFLKNSPHLQWKYILFFNSYMEVLFEKKRMIPHNKCMATAGRSQREYAKPPKG